MCNSGVLVLARLQEVYELTIFDKLSGLAPHMAPDGAFPLRNPSRPTGQYDLLHFPSQENAYADDHAQAYPPSMPAPRMLPPTMDPSRLLHRQISMPAIRAESVSESELEMDDGGESDHGWDRQLGKDDVAGWGRHPDTIGIDIPVFHDKKTKGDVRDAAGIQVPVVMHARFVLKKRAARQRHFMILYRRNYFGIQASYNLVPLPDSSPNETLYLYRNHHKPKPIQAMFMCMRGVVETEEGPEIKIVVFNAKRKPLHEGKEPPPIEPQRMKPLTEGSTKYYSESTGNRQDHIRVPMNHTFHRNQFRAATQNNGARRTEQQTYHILLELKAEIIVGGVPELFTVASRMSEPLVVRGRCPLSFKAKDDHAPDHDRKGSNPSGDRGRRKGKGRSTTQSQKEGQAKGAGRGPCNKTGGSSSRRSTRATSLRTEAPEFQDLGIL